METNPISLARQFHETYERLAPSFGYSTREETRKFDPESSNGKLMIAVCNELLNGKSRIEMSWACNECGTIDLTDAVGETDLESFQCSNCGANEFHLVPS